MFCIVKGKGNVIISLCEQKFSAKKRGETSGGEGNTHEIPYV